MVEIAVPAAALARAASHAIEIEVLDLARAAGVASNALRAELQRLRDAGDPHFYTPERGRLTRALHQARADLMLACEELAS